MKTSRKRVVKAAVAAALLLIGVLCLANIIDVAAVHYAVVELYETFAPSIESWNFPGTSTAPTIIPPGDFKPEVLVQMDGETDVDMFTSVCTIDGSNWAVYWDLKKSPGKVYTGNLVTSAGQRHRIIFQIVFTRPGGSVTLTADGYVQGGEATGKWYLNSYDLSKLGDYEVLRMPYAGAVTLKFAASSGGGYVETVYFKIWKARTGIDGTQYEQFYPTPDWKVILNKQSGTTTWSSSWTPPAAGKYVMYGYITMSGKQYRQLSVIPMIGEAAPFGLNQLLGSVMVAAAAVLGWSLFRE